MRREPLKFSRGALVSAMMLVVGGAVGGGGDQAVFSAAPAWSVERLASRSGHGSVVVAAVQEGVLVRYAKPRRFPTELVFVRRGIELSLATQVWIVTTSAAGDAFFNGVRDRQPGSFVFRNGRVERLAGLGDGSVSGGNARGEIVGSRRSETGGRGFVWRDGSFTSIPPLDGQNHSGALQIDEHGLVLAASSSDHPSMLDSTVGDQLFLWMNGAITRLGPYDELTRPLLRNGRLLMNRRKDGPILWEDGKVVELGPKDRAMTAMALNEDGVVVGYWESRAQGFVWERGRTIPFQLPGGRGARVAWGGMNIDEHRTVLLSMAVPPKPDDEPPGPEGWPIKAFVLTGSQVHELPSLGGTQSEAVTFADDGDILGTSTDATGVRHAVRWYATRDRNVP